MDRRGAKLPLVVVSCPPGIEQAPGDEWWLLLLLGVGVPNKVFEVQGFFFRACSKHGFLTQGGSWIQKPL